MWKKYINSNVNARICANKAQARLWPEDRAGRTPAAPALSLCQAGRRHVLKTARQRRLLQNDAKIQLVIRKIVSCFMVLM